jgi:hypothetical protein
MAFHVRQVQVAKDHLGSESIRQLKSGISAVRDFCTVAVQAQVQRKEFGGAVIAIDYQDQNASSIPFSCSRLRSMNRILSAGTAVNTFDGGASLHL